MPTKEKIKEVEEFRGILHGAKAVVVSRSSGMTVAEVTELRAKLREAGIVHRVVKNTLGRIVAREEKMEGLAKLLQGPTVVTISKSDIVAPAKILVSFAKDHQKLVILGGMFEGKDASAQEVADISALPSKEELLAKMLGAMNNPITGLVRVLNGPLQGFARALQAIAEKKAAAGA